MNRVEAMTQLGDTLGVTPAPTSITGIVAAMGGTRATAALMGVDISDRSDEGKKHIASAQRTLQRYMKAEAGVTGKNVRGQKEADRKALTDKLRGPLAAYKKAQADAKHPRGFHATVTGNFVVSETTQPGRPVKPIYIPREDMDKIIEQIQAGEYEKAAVAFDAAFSFSYLNDSPSMSWGVRGGDDAHDYDSLEID